VTSVTPFFIPGMAGESQLVEREYEEMRRQVEEDMGRRPSARRILQLWARRGSIDCVTEVGRPDPLRGGTVMAIFDMGPHQPFVVWWQPGLTERDGVRDVLAPNAYSVLEFDS
jgi:hypothetical protein